MQIFKRIGSLGKWPIESKIILCLHVNTLTVTHNSFGSFLLIQVILYWKMQGLQNMSSLRKFMFGVMTSELHPKISPWIIIISDFLAMSTRFNLIYFKVKKFSWFNLSIITVKSIQDKIQIQDCKKSKIGTNSKGHCHSNFIPDYHNFIVLVYVLENVELLCINFLSQIHKTSSRLKPLFLPQILH